VAPDVQEDLELRGMIQREFKGQKRKNVARYREFIADVTTGKIDGDMPEVVLWVRSRLDVGPGPAGLVVVTIPPNCRPVVVDGETQVAARFDLVGNTPLLDNASVVVRLHHDRPVEFASQLFYFRNVRGTEVPRAFALMRDRYNAVAQAARDLIPMLGEQFSEVGSPRSVKLPMLMQALCWLTFGTKNEPVRKPSNWEHVLEASTDHLERRLAVLAPLFAVPSSPLYQAPIFIGCCDRTVREEVLTAKLMGVLQRNFRIRGAGNAAVRGVIQFVREVSALDDDDDHGLGETWSSPIF